MIRLAIAVGISALLCSTARADDARLRISGRVSSGLKPDFHIALKSSNPLCFGKTLDVAADVTIQDDHYTLTADWGAGFCGYSKGTAALSIIGKDGSAEIDFLFGQSGDGYVELRDIAEMKCGTNDDNGGPFGCMIVKTDSSSLIGNDLFIGSAEMRTEYQLDIVTLWTPGRRR